MQTHKRSHSKGFSLIELTVVISIMLLLTGATFLGVKAYSNWQKGLDAGESLKKIYTAQKLYLAQHPTKAVTSITEADVINYMPDGSTALPTAEGLDGETLTIDVTTSPPVFNNGADVYDPSGNLNDNLWDTGK